MRELVVLAISALVLAIGVAAGFAIPNSGQIDSQGRAGGSGYQAPGRPVAPLTEGRSVFVIPSPWGASPGPSDYLTSPDGP